MGFSKDFMWGASASAYQIEGAYDTDGKGASIWDIYSRMSWKIHNKENGDVTCDHYHRYKEDIALMKELGLKTYHFSISWPRVLPEGIGQINEKGLEFYSLLVDELLVNGIEPIVTLYHWDFPNALQRKGGWLNRESADWFADYTKIIVDNLSDRVKYWITLSEPQVFVGLGYQDGTHAPFMQLPLGELAQLAHHVLLAHGKAVKIIREYAKQKPIIGFAPTGPCTTPTSSDMYAIHEAYEASFSFEADGFIFSNSWWGDPIVFGKYPDISSSILKDYMPHIEPGDMQIISQPIDFYGATIHQSQEAFSYLPSVCKSYYQGAPRTTMDWLITPDALYWSARFLHQRYHLPILIAKNGMAGPDLLYEDGKIHDLYRINFLKQYLKGLEKAADEGIPIMGYACYTLTDNFEWHYGYDKRFGLIYVDYNTQKRIIKDSGYWYKEVIAHNGVDF